MKFPMLIQLGENGQITLPAELLAAIDAKPGDWLPVRVEESEVRVREPSKVAKSLEALGTALREAGVTEEELIKSGREIRKQLVRERYPGLFGDPKSSPGNRP